MPASCRRAGQAKHGDDRANLELILGQLADLEPAAPRSLRAALALPDGTGNGRPQAVLPGSITRAPRGTNGLATDPIFVPEATDTRPRAGPAGPRRISTAAAPSAQ